MQTSTEFKFVHERKYHGCKDSAYWLPNDTTEQERLNLQHHLLKRMFGGNVLKSVTENLDFQRSKLKVLDVACGTGIWLKDMQREFPNCIYEGCDINISKEETISTVQSQTTDDEKFCTGDNNTASVATIKQTYGDVIQGLNYPDDTFDFVHMRLLIAAFKKDQWPIAIKELLRVTKPGGMIQLLEHCSLVAGDESNPFHRAWKAVREILEERGMDPRITSHLPAMIESHANARIIESHKRYIDLGSHADWAQGMIIQNRELFHSMMPLLAGKLGINTDEEGKEFLTSICQPEAFKESNAYYVAMSVRKSL